MSDPLLDYMKRNGMVINRQAYLDLAYGADRESLTAEEEASLPEEVRVQKAPREE